MPEIRQTDCFAQWHAALRDRVARAKVTVRIDRMQLGNFGDVKPVGSGVSEIRVNYGPGYRLYFCQQGSEVVILLAGGDKGTQQDDIAKAVELKNGLKEAGQ